MEPKPYTILLHPAFLGWLSSLKDRQARARLKVRLARLQEGNPGDYRDLGGDLVELRIPYGPGYRIYLTVTDTRATILYGGTKQGQSKDIKAARTLLEEAQNDH